MNENIIPYVYDFLSMVFEDKEVKEEIREVILFGSVAKKIHDEGSDIDLFFNIRNTSEGELIEERLRTILKSFEIKAEKTWNVKLVKLPINFIVGSLEDDAWKNLREEIVSAGILLYGNYKELPEKMEHYFLIYYSLENLKRKDKMRFIRKMFGYRLKREKKEYKQKGLLEKKRGLKLGSNVILIPIADVSNVRLIFKKFKIKYKVRETWMRR